VEIPAHQALLVALLAVNQQQWVHRRVEEIQYLDARSVRRRVSIDFTVPEDWPDDQPLHLPVAQFVKAPLVHFDLTDEEGTPLPMLTAAQNGAITTAVLRTLARAQPQPIDFIVDKYIARLVFTTRDPVREEALTKIFQPGTAVGDALSLFTPFRALTHDVARNFILYLPVDAAQRGRRRIVKLAFDRGEDVAAPARPREWLGLAPVKDRFRIPAAGSAASYHVEISPPPDMRVVHAEFEARRAGHVVKEPVRDLLTPRAHLNLSRVDRGFGIVSVEARAESSVLTGAMVFAVLSAVTLWFVLARLGEFIDPEGSDAFVGAIVALPGVALAYIIRPTEHAVASAFLVGFRVLALAAALASFAAAIVLSAGYTEDQIYRVVRGLVGLASASALGLLSSWAAQRTASRRVDGTA
jgi:hypothetical protein